MPAAYQDQYLEQGTTFNTQITLDDNSGNAYNLAGFSVYSQAKKSYYSSNVILNFSSSVYDAANGIIQISANSATTANLPTGKMVYDVIISDNTGSVTRVLEGKITVSPGVTNVTGIAPGSPPNTNTNSTTDL
jgi:hypothetical protein